ncbi:MAG TPA: hypothetical protein GXZ55_01230 [Natronincola sp.]|nr:hypothetical protein [Natronincola sp.]
MEIMAESLKKGYTREHTQRKIIDLYDTMWRVNRNDPCPCGSGLKYKKCCLVKFKN